MCGIAGAVAGPAATLSRSALTGAMARLAHRGPDDAGWTVWQDDGHRTDGRDGIPDVGRIALLHRRLSIIDVSDGGHQPMATVDGRLTIAFNGEIYNYVELRAELEAAGARFRSDSDTEVLLAAWEAWGEAALPRLVGMFAFAILDRDARELVLARDPFGIKPLLLAEANGGIAFASEHRALLALRRGRPRADPRVLYDYLRWGAVDEGAATFFDGIEQLPAGCVARIPLDRPAERTVSPYWSLPTERIDVPFDEAAARVRELFCDSIRLHLRSDVPVGSALSGGIDSSAIVAAVRAVGGPDVDLRTFSYIAADPRYDEERWVDLVAGATGAQVHKVRPGAHDLRDQLDALVGSQGEPFGSTSIFAQRCVFAAAREQGVVVLLDGQGADELFAGYSVYLGAKVRELLRAGNVAAAARLAGRVAKQSGAGVLGRAALRSIAPALPASLRTAALARAGDTAFPPWLRADWFAARGVVDVAAGPSHRKGRLDDSLTSAFTSTRLPALLRYEDRNSMAFSLESRVPFLTPPLVDYVFSLPAEHVMSDDGLPKKVFREAMRGLVPDAVLDRRDKIGFNTPQAAWLRELAPWVDRTLSGDAAQRMGCLDLDVVREATVRARTAKRDDGTVWRWLNAVRWADIYDVEL